ncbi:MAG: radical SAM enzyme, Cfr family protein [Myxococcota bacterium]
MDPVITLVRPPPGPSVTAFLPAHSTVDVSVNWTRTVDVGMLEARYVRRTDDYVVVYLSSQTGCRQACRMCHLTATGQTALRDATKAELWEQADVVLEHVQTQPQAKVVHYNFMARGEPLASAVLLDDADDVLDGLWHRARAVDLKPRFLVSTILPKSLGNRALEDVFDRYRPEIYYSLYSVDEGFRRRWLPKALPVSDALARLASWQRHTYKLVKIHYAFIAGENDAPEHVEAVCDALEAHRLLCHINLVRYNPPSDRHGVESDPSILEAHAARFAERLPHARVKVIPRVGYDVQASCGMFVE